MEREGHLPFPPESAELFLQMQRIAGQCNSEQSDDDVDSNWGALETSRPIKEVLVVVTADSAVPHSLVSVFGKEHGCCTTWPTSAGTTRFGL